MDSSGKTQTQDSASMAEIQANLDLIKRRLHFLDGYDVEKMETLQDEIQSLRDLLA